MRKYRKGRSLISRENKEYLILGSELICDKGEFESKFEVSPKNIKLQGYYVASQADNVAGKHIKSFGSCSVTGKCKMESDLYGQFLIWFETYSKVILAGSEALLEDSYCFCPYGGRITISDSRQIDYASAMTELFGDFADTVEQMKDSMENLSDMAVKSLIGMFDGAMTEYFTNEENRLRSTVRDMERNNKGNSYMYMQTGYDPREELAQLQRSKQIYEADNWQDIKNVNLRDIYAKMQENPNKVDLEPRRISGLMALTNPLFAAGYYIETKVRDIRSVLPDMTIGDFFSRGTSKEGITELWEKGMDCQNKKMLPGVLGYHPLQAAYAGGYTNYDPMESAQIVNSLSDDGKAAYMLRKTANDGMSAYNEIYGYYQMVKALDMSTKGKVKTGSKSKDEKILNNSSLKSSKIRGTEVVSDELLEKVKLRRDVVIAKEGTDDYVYLTELMNAEGVAGGEGNTNILLREKAAKLTVVEEFLHGTQVRVAQGNNIPLKASVGYGNNYVNQMEWQVRDFMYRHKKMFGWSQNELRILKEELDYWYKLKNGM